MLQLKEFTFWTKVYQISTFSVLDFPLLFEFVQIPVIFETRSQLLYKLCTILQYLSENTGVKCKWNFQSVHRILNLLFQRTLFLMFLLKNIKIHRLEQTSWQTVFFTTLVLQDQPQGYILSYFFKLLRDLSRILVEFSLTCIFQHVWEECFNLWCSHSQKKLVVQKASDMLRIQLF